jgi:gliding-associated putative ABC transporter substrate-binding component GldG
MQLMDWPFFPLINQYAGHPITRNLDAVVTRFVSSIDTVKADNVKKTPLLFTSRYSHKVVAPVLVSVNELRKRIRDNYFTEGQIPLAFLLEGKFTSLYRNRFLPAGADKESFVEMGKETKIFVMADGDVARNDINPRTGNPQQLGFDPFTGYTFANEEFLLNAVAYLTDENGLIRARNKQVMIRPLDKVRAATEEFKWQLINLGAPLVLLIAFGVIRSYLRKRKFASF